MDLGVALLQVFKGLRTGFADGPRAAVDVLGEHPAWVDQGRDGLQMAFYLGRQYSGYSTGQFALPEQFRDSHGSIDSITGEIALSLAPGPGAVKKDHAGSFVGDHDAEVGELRQLVAEELLHRAAQGLPCSLAIGNDLAIIGAAQGDTLLRQTID